MFGLCLCRRLNHVWTFCKSKDVESELEMQQPNLLRQEWRDMLKRDMLLTGRKHRGETPAQ